MHCVEELHVSDRIRASLRQTREGAIVEQKSWGRLIDEDERNSRPTSASSISVGRPVDIDEVGMILTGNT